MHVRPSHTHHGAVAASPPMASVASIVVFMVCFVGCVGVEESSRSCLKI